MTDNFLPNYWAFQTDLIKPDLYRLFKCISAHANEGHSLFRTFLNHAFETCLEIAICTLLGNSVVVVLALVAKRDD